MAGRLGSEVSVKQLQGLIDEVVARRSDLTARSIGMVFNGLGKMGLEGVVTGDQVQLLVETFVIKLQEASPVAIGSTVWGLAAIGQQVPAEQLQLLLERMVEALGDSGYEQAVSNTFWGLATMGVEQLPASQLGQLVACFSSNLAAANGEQIAVVLWGVWTLTSDWAPEARWEFVSDFTGEVAKLPAATIAATIWEYGKLNHAFLPAAKLEQLLEGLISKIADAEPQDLANAAWGVAKVAKQGPEEQLLKIVSAFADKLEAAPPRSIACMFWALARLERPVYPAPLLTGKAVRVILSKLPDMTPRELAYIAWGCGRLGHRNVKLLTVLYGTAMAKLAGTTAVAGGAVARAGVESADVDSSAAAAAAASASAVVGGGDGVLLSDQDLADLCWGAAVLDLRHLSKDVQQLAAAFSSRSEGQLNNYKLQLYQVHVWLKDYGLGGCLSQKQQERCREAWRGELAAAEDASKLQQAVYAAALKLPWCRRRPVLEARTDDGHLSIDILVMTATGARVAIEVDGHCSHFTSPNRMPSGSTRWRNRALAARGYVVVSVPYWEWDEVVRGGMQAQVTYLDKKVGQGISEAKEAKAREKLQRQAGAQKAKELRLASSKAAAAAYKKLGGKESQGAGAAPGKAARKLKAKSAAAAAADNKLQGKGSQGAVAASGKTAGKIKVKSAVAAIGDKKLGVKRSQGADVASKRSPIAALAAARDKKAYKKRGVEGEQAAGAAPRKAAAKLELKSVAAAAADMKLGGKRSRGAGAGSGKSAAAALAAARGTVADEKLGASAARRTGGAPLKAATKKECQGSSSSHRSCCI